MCLMINRGKYSHIQEQFEHFLGNYSSLISSNYSLTSPIVSYSLEPLLTKFLHFHLCNFDFFESKDFFSQINIIL